MSARICTGGKNTKGSKLPERFGKTALLTSWRAALADEATGQGLQHGSYRDITR
jgi:hypothetical protein